MEPNALGDLAGALAKAQAAFPKVVKDREAKIQSAKGAYSYRYADLATLIDAIRKPLADNGLAYLQTMEVAERGLLLVTRLVHTGGGVVYSYYPLRDHERPQDMGSEITYARRYSLSAMLGLASEDDDDGTAAQQAAPPARARAPRVMAPQGGGMPPQSEDQTKKEAEALFPTPEEEEQRAFLVGEAGRLGDKLKLSPTDKGTFVKTYLGGASPQQADLSALADMVNALKARAGEPK